AAECCPVTKILRRITTQRLLKCVVKPSAVTRSDSGDVTVITAAHRHGQHDGHKFLFRNPLRLSHENVVKPRPPFLTATVERIHGYPKLPLAVQLEPALLVIPVKIWTSTNAFPRNAW